MPLNRAEKLLLVGLLVGFASGVAGMALYNHVPWAVSYGLCYAGLGILAGYMLAFLYFLWKYL